MGVCPCGAQVLTTLGISRKPDSSAMTIWAPSLAAFFYARPLLLLPAFDLLFIPLQCTPFRLLWSPSQAVHQAADMVRVIAHTKLTFDHLGNARRSPKIGSVALCHRSLEQKGAKPLSLASRQLQGAPRRKAYLQCIHTAVSTRVSPAHHRTRIASDLSSYFIERESIIQQCQSTPASILKEIGAPLQSGHKD